MPQPRYDRDQVEAELLGDVRARLEQLGLPGRAQGREWRSSLCPACGPRSRPDAVAINLDHGRWLDHAHGCRGDIFDLVASVLGLDARRDFATVLSRAAELAGVAPAARAAAAPSFAEIERRARDRHERALADRLGRRECAIARATAHWARLASPSSPVAGVCYLVSRGLNGAVARGLVRFEPDGDVAVPLHAGDGRIVDVVRRRLPGRSPKAWGLRGGMTDGTLVGALPDIVGPVDVVITEGVTDALAAALAWPRSVVLGAHGAARYEMIARAAARRVRLAGGRLLLCIDADVAGERVGTAAGIAALDVGLELDRTLLLVDHGPAKDLAEAWLSGWRPAA